MRSTNRIIRVVENMSYVILSPCIDIKDGACVDVCPVNCIHESEKMFYIDFDACIDCALCESVCPVDAIRRINDVPESEIRFIQINRDLAKRAWIDP